MTHPADARALSMVLTPGPRRGKQGMFDHDIMCPVLNPAFDPKAAGRYALVTASLEKDGYYDTHTRQECAEEWRKRYDALKAQGQ